MFVPVMAAGVRPPITIPLTVPPVRTAFPVVIVVAVEVLELTAPEAVMLPVVIEEGLVPSSTIVAEAFSVKIRLSVTLTANSP
jgi:hypothetical protein